MPKDLYDVLGIQRGASAEEITKAYKKLARQYHPDKNPGDKTAEAKFKEVQNAYDILNDPKKKEAYDRFGYTGEGGMPSGGAGGFPFGYSGGGFGGTGGATEIDPQLANELLNQIFGGGAGAAGGAGGFADIFGGATSGRRGRKSRRAAYVEPIEIEATVPFLTAINGGTIGLRVGDRDIDVKVPAGFEDGKKLRVAGQGENGEDIMVKVRVTPHPYFKREGKDVLLEVPISLSEAFLGGKVEVPTPNGKRVEVKIKPGTSSSTKMRLPGFGAAGGDMYLLFRVQIPKTELDETSQKLLQQFLEKNPYDARSDTPWR